MKLRAIDVTVRVLLPAAEAGPGVVATTPDALRRGFDPDIAAAKERMVFHGRVVNVDDDAEVTEEDEVFDRGGS